MLIKSSRGKSACRKDIENQGVIRDKNKTGTCEENTLSGVRQIRQKAAEGFEMLEGLRLQLLEGPGKESRHCLGAQIDPQLTDSKDIGTSVLQPQVTRSSQQHERVQKQTILKSLQSWPCETVSRELS